MKQGREKKADKRGEKLENSVFPPIYKGWGEFVVYLTVLLRFWASFFIWLVLMNELLTYAQWPIPARPIAVSASFMTYSSVKVRGVHMEV